MSTIYRIFLAGAASLVAGTSLAATPIDSEQKLASATLEGINFITSQPNRLSTTIDRARASLEGPLAQLAATTTPAGLAGTPGGLTLPCNTSGSISARMARGLPRVLRLEWNDCAFLDTGGFQNLRDGSGEVLLLSNSFAPDKLGSIRLGSTASDFTDERTVSYPGTILHEHRTMNLRVAGVIPFRRAFDGHGVFIGPFAYDVVGFLDEVDTYQSPESNFPPFETHNRVSADHVFATGKVEYSGENNRHYSSDTTLWGELAFSIFNWPPIDERQTVSRLEGLRLREDYDFVSFTSSLAIDGRVDHQPISWPDGSNDGCLAGERVYRTRAPLAGAAFSGAYDSGEIAVNGSSALFYSAANVPASQPIPSQGYMVRLDVRNAGPVYHDTASQQDTLREVGECLFPQ